MRSVPLYFFLFLVISSINIGIFISKPPLKYVGETTGLIIGDDSLCLRFEFKHLNEGMIFNVLKTGVGCKALDTEKYQKPYLSD
jgi:acyl-[acyl carrier protein]--UDP-N-acetylglucosamine O-acyltransferase